MLSLCLIVSSASLPRPRRRGPVNGDECYFWRTTGCHFGDKCRYKHIPDQKGKDRKPWQPWAQPTLCPSSVQETGIHRLTHRRLHLLEQLPWAKNVFCSRMDQNSQKDQSQHSGSKAGIVTRAHTRMSHINQRGATNSSGVVFVLNEKTQGFMAHSDLSLFKGFNLTRKWNCLVN